MDISSLVVKAVVGAMPLLTDEITEPREEAADSWTLVGPAGAVVICMPVSRIEETVEAIPDSASGAVLELTSLESSVAVVVDTSIVVVESTFPDSTSGRDAEIVGAVLERFSPKTSVVGVVDGESMLVFGSTFSGSTSGIDAETKGAAVEFCKTISGVDDMLATVSLDDALKVLI